MLKGDLYTRKYMYSLYTHTQYQITTTSLNAAIFKPCGCSLILDIRQQLRLTPETVRGPSPFSSFIKGFIYIPQLTDQSEKETSRGPATLKKVLNDFKPLKMVPQKQHPPAFPPTDLIDIFEK